MARNSTMSALVASGPWPGTILVLSFDDLEIGVHRADHAAHVAAIGEVDVLIALEIVERVAGGQHVGVREIDPGVAVGVGVGDMGQLRLAAAHFQRERAAEIGLLRQRFGRPRRRLGAGQAGDGAGREAHPDVVVRHDGDAVLGEVLVPAGVIAMDSAC